MKPPTATYDQPVPAKLVVRLSNGQEWDATEADLHRFRLDSPHECYMRFDDALRKILDNAGLLGDRGDITTAALNAVRYLVETAVVYPDLLDHADHHGWVEVVAVEQAIRQAWGGTEPPEEVSRDDGPA
jgi:hypothetical protein